MAKKLEVMKTMIMALAIAAISTMATAEQPAATVGISKSSMTTRNVKIINELRSNVTLTIHCRSEDDDLGEHNLKYRDSFSWKFKSRLFIHSTLFYCSMSWSSVTGKFDVYSGTRDDDRCADKCWWRIRTDGAYSFDEKHNRWDLLYEW